LVNHHYALAGGHFEKKEVHVHGFDLYHLSPENYPVAIRGSGNIFGWMYTFDDIDQALIPLDWLEGLDMNPPLYERITSITNTGEMVWMYLGKDLERYKCGDGATIVSNGIWLPEPSGSEENSQKISK
jgi:gamma-glutamylcyclotransferase (GGCT)/AIG2-like uncharacterized protein YtfP